MAGNRGRQLSMESLSNLFNLSRDCQRRIFLATDPLQKNFSTGNEVKIQYLSA